MQIGQPWKIKMYNPRILLNSVKYSFLAWIGVSATQLTLNDVAFSNIKTIKKTIGAVGVAGCDFNFATAANTTEQVIDLGTIIPALARILDVKTITNVAFSSAATTLVAETGVTSSGNELIASATILAENAITAMAHAAGLNTAPTAAARKVYVSATPGANWSGIVAGKLTIYITYIETV